MRKKILAVIFLIILSGVIKTHSSSGSENNQAPYRLAFTSCGANLLESHINCWVKINVDPSDAAMSHELLTILNSNSVKVFPEDIVIVKEAEKVAAIYNYPALNITFSIMNIRAENLSYFVIEADGDMSNYNQQTEYIKRFMQNKIFTEYYEFTGEINRTLNRDAQKAILKTILETLDAESMEYYEDQNVISVTGFSPAIKIQPVEKFNKKYNLQAAVKSNPQQGKTSIYFGYPLLLNNY